MAHKNINCQQAKQIDMVGYLQNLNIHPKSIKGNNYWYYSPLHIEQTPSFKIDRKLNVWYDHSIGKGGNLIDFGMLYFHCSISDFLKQVNQSAKSLSFHQPYALQKENGNAESKMKIIDVRIIADNRLLNYLNERAIDTEIAKANCKEIVFEVCNKQHSCIGFKNNAGGYELRNKYYKGCIAPKDVTLIDNRKMVATVFEGFFDFLSYLTIEQDNPYAVTNYLVLNSLSFFQKARLQMERHLQINIQLDRDQAGRSCTMAALKSHPAYNDQSSFYEGHKDLNEWLIARSKRNNAPL